MGVVRVYDYPDVMGGAVLSIGKVCRGEQGEQYYMMLHAEDYYLRQGSGELPGQWGGSLSGDLGLNGVVGEEDFRKLLNGIHPISNRQLRRIQKNGRPGFDLTYSVPKDFSIAYMVAPPELKRRMEAELFASIKKAFGYIEDEACRTRLGAGGREVVKGEGLVVALFFHMISRELDPQIHVHAIVFNFTRGPDGQYRSLHGSKLYEHKMAAGALFRTELAARTEKLNFELERDGCSWRVKWMPQSLRDELSKHSVQIRQELGDTEATAAQKAVANLKSREPKQDIDRDKVLAESEDVAKRHGVTREQLIKHLADAKIPVRNEQAERQAALQEAFTQLTSSGSAFTERDLIKQTAVEAQTRGVGAEQVRDEVSSALKPATREMREDTEVVRLGMHADGYERFTTRELFKCEQEIIESVERRRHSRAHPVTEGNLLHAIPTKRPVKTEQIAAAMHVTQGEGDVVCVSGRAGTGKTTMVGIARRAWEKEGYTVLGCALSGKAAGELSEGAKIKGVTIAKLFYDLDNPGRKDRLKLNSKTVLVVDEAGMVGTRALHRLVMEAERAGARLVLVGDARQLQSIDAGGGFAGLAKRLGHAELKEIIRQQDPEDRQAVTISSRGILARHFEAILPVVASSWAKTKQTP